MKELVVISGKGGTGKTSLVASFAALAKPTMLADCDVDAADLHLVLSPRVRREEPFSGGSAAQIVAAKCAGCGRCALVCRFDAILPPSGIEGAYRVDAIGCEGCGVCARECPEGAIEFGPVVNGAWFSSETDYGPMIHARLTPGEENSGKLVSLVRKEAREQAEADGYSRCLVDGSPGVGCPVIASITGAALVLVVTEPTLSGMHDFERVAELVARFRVPAMLCVNKWDLNPEMAEKLEAAARGRGVRPVGRIRYDEAVTRAQVAGKPVVGFEDNECAREIEAVWTAVQRQMRALDEALEEAATRSEEA